MAKKEDLRKRRLASSPLQGFSYEVNSGKNTNNNKTKGIPYRRLNTSPEGLDFTFSQEGLEADYFPGREKEEEFRMVPSKEKEASVKQPTSKVSPDLRPTAKKKQVVVEEVSKEAAREIVEKAPVEEPKEKKKGLMDNFKQALTHFGPQLGGMLIGGLMEGSEGAVAGGEAGIQAHEGMFKHSLQEQQANIAAQNANTQAEYAALSRERLEKPNFNIAQGWTTPDGGAAFFDKSTGKTYDSAGNPTEVVAAKEEISPLEQARIENYRRIEADREFKRQQRNESDAQRALKDMRATELYKSASSTLSTIPELRNLLDDAQAYGGQSLSMLGPKAARGLAGEVGVMTDADIKRYVQNPSLIGGLRDSLAKAKSGKISQVSADNMRRLLDIQEKAANDKIKKAKQREAELFSRRAGISFQEALSYIDETASVYSEANSDSPDIKGAVQRSRAKLLGGQ